MNTSTTHNNKPTWLEEANNAPMSTGGFAKWINSFLDSLLG